MSEFKVGDVVYCSLIGLGIYKLDENGDARYPMRVGDYTFTLDGKSLDAHHTPDIFHATDENKKALEFLMGVEFEAPKKKGSDLTRQMLSESDVPVLCYVSGISDEYAVMNGYASLVGMVKDRGFVAVHGSSWRYAVPYDKEFRTALT